MRQVPMRVSDFAQKKSKEQKISMITCYDYPSARIISETNIDTILVGDSVAQAVHGYDNTIMANIEMMAMHTEAVSRGTDKQFIVSDLPFLSYRGSKESTIENVFKLMQAGAHAIKLEGADPNLYETISHITNSGVPVMGHLGLTPQYLHALSGYKVQGRTEKDSNDILNKAKLLQECGCFAIVLECVPSALSAKITKELTIPTIGIGAGTDTDGQVLVWHDLLGLQTEFQPKFVKKFVDAKTILKNAIDNFVGEVQNQTFPSPEHSFA